MNLPSPPAMTLFVAQVLALSLYGLAVSGHFPREVRKPALAAGAGPAVLWSTMAAAACSALSAVAFAGAALPWPAAVIGGGAALLFAPLVLQLFPDPFVDGRAGLLVLATLAVALTWSGWALTRF